MPLAIKRNRELGKLNSSHDLASFSLITRCQSRWFWEHTKFGLRSELVNLLWTAFVSRKFTKLKISTANWSFRSFKVFIARHKQTTIWIYSVEFRLSHSGRVLVVDCEPPENDSISLRIIIISFSSIWPSPSSSSLVRSTLHWLTLCVHGRYRKTTTLYMVGGRAKCNAGNGSDAHSRNRTMCCAANGFQWVFVRTYCVVCKWTSAPNVCVLHTLAH